MEFDELIAVVRYPQGFQWFIPPEYAYEFNERHLFIKDETLYKTETEAKEAFKKALKQKSTVVNEVC